MVVETRSQKNKPKPEAMQGQSSAVTHGRPSSARKGNGDEPPASAFTSISGSSATAKSLAIQAEYAKKIAAMERAVMERERGVMEREREAMELEAQAKLAALEESRTIRSKTSSKLSNQQVEAWLDTCINSAIPPDVTAEPSQGVKDTSPPSQLPIHLNEKRSTMIPQRDNLVVNTEPLLPVSRVAAKKHAYIGDSTRPLRPVTGTVMQEATLDRGLFAGDIGLSQSVPTDLQMPTLLCAKTHLNAGQSEPKQSTDIELLAQAITSLASNSKRKFNDGRLPLFEGKPLDWLAFKRVFEDTKTSYSASDNIARLTMALKGAAREAVSVLLVCARDPQEIITALELRFGRPELVVLQEVSTLRALPKLSFECRELNSFACRIRNAVEVMRLLSHRPYLDSPELFSVILSKLTPLMRTRWTDFGSAHFHPGGETKLELLATFLEREASLQLQFGLLTQPTSDSQGPFKKVEKVHTSYTTDTAQTLAQPSSSGLGKSTLKSGNSENKSANSENKQCSFCQKSSHILSQCDKFLTSSTNDKWQFVKDNKLCHKCFKRGSHSYKFCKSTKEICLEKDCYRRHHKLLHDSTSNVAHINVENEAEGGGAPTSSSDPSTEFVAHACSHSASSEESQPNYRPLLKVVAVTVSGPSGSVDAYALLDDGSTVTFIEEDLATQIGVQGPADQVRLNCVGGLSKSVQVQYVDFQIKGRYATETNPVTKARAIRSLGLCRQTVSHKTITEFPQLSDLASMLCYDNVQPKIIIGIDNWHLTLSQTTRKGTKSQPVAIKTALGWVLFGFGTSRTKPVDRVDYINHVGLAENTEPFDNSAIESLIREQYKLDSIGISKREPHSKDDERAIQILERTANRLPSGRFEVGLLWKTYKPIVPNSYPLALSRLLSLEKKFLKDPAYAARYKQNIQDVLDKDYAEKCHGEPISDSVCWYLPHFGVVNPNKPAKLRVVNDAAAQTKGVSLNSLLLTGPDLLQSLFEILLRFREGKIAMTADIKEMFPRFKIIERDRDAQRFLWRDNPKEPIEIYRMSSMIFGAVSSPFTAMYMKNKNALEVKDQYPEAVEAIINDTYMDDFIGSVGSVSEASNLASNIVKIHARAGLEMRGWISNDPAALQHVPKQLLSDSMSVDLGSAPTPSPYTRALGLIWHPFSDTIGFNTPIKSSEQGLPDRLTKRVVLSLLMRVFDPLGILAPITIRGRILFQNAWRERLEWDAQLPQAEVAVWNDWLRDLKVTSELTIPRCYNLSMLVPIQVELHVFADASEQAYAAVAYWRFLFSNGNVQLALVSSKCRVSPLKPSSIPRLELQAALIAARLASSIVAACRLKPSSRFFWTDSMNVLGWLRNDARRYKPFVAHRVGEIIELTDVGEWRWVPGELNVADDATRLKFGPLSLESRWISGPEFLLSSDWPTEPTTDLPILETKPTRDHIHLINDEAALSHPLSAEPRRFSSWFRLIRTTARSHRFLTLLRISALQKKGIHVDLSCRVDGLLVSFIPQSSPTTITHGCRDINDHALRSTLSSDDLILAEIHVLRKSQMETFAEEINCLENGRPFSHRSRLSKLPGYLDKHHLLRLSSRIVAVTGVDEDVKMPIILDGKHPAVQLLVLHYHRKAAHANTEMVVNELRQRYWILSLRNTVRSVAYHCRFCQVRRATPPVPVMGNLPQARMAHHHRPFTFIGLDYFGPLTITIGRRKEKRYVALFTCLTVRAIHLEVVFSLSTDAAIMALRRFIARRGTPSEIYSDNGTAFVGASRVLRALYGEAVADFAASEMIKWKFLPPSAPFMAGATERLVKSVKTSLKVTLTSRSPSDEVLSTLLCEAETLINSRPLTHVTSDPDYPEGLTPHHFILGSSSGRPIPANLNNSDLCSRAGWRRALRMADHFWQRWVKEYLPTLSPSRIRGEIPSLAVGDPVFIADGNLPRGSWPRGRIVALYPGRDGITRVIDVATGAGVLRRPVRKVVPLPV